MKELFHKMRSEIFAVGDNNACGPIAIALITGVPVLEVTNTLFKRGERVKGKGTSTHAIFSYLSREGYSALNVTENVRARGGLTPRTLTKVLNPKAKYLVFVDGHVLAVLDGKICDWTEGRKHRVKSVWQMGKVTQEMLPLRGTPKAEPTELLETLAIIRQLHRDAHVWGISSTRVTGREMLVEVDRGFTLYYRVNKQGEFSVSVRNEYTYDRVAEAMGREAETQNKQNSVWTIGDLCSLAVFISALHA